MSLIEILSKFSKSNPKCTLNVETFRAPFGNIIAVADDNFLYLVSFEDSIKLRKQIQLLSQKLSCDFIVNNENKILQQFNKELTTYFDGGLTKFNTPIKIFGSVFQKEVWLKLQDLPYASTETYGELAKRMGRATSHARAVGSACGANAHLLIVPCHRLIASDSKGGFSSGIHRKEWLLQHEQKYASIS